MGNKKTFPLEEVQKLIDQNFKIIDIANRFNTSRVTMGKFLKENNLKTKISMQREKTATVNEDEIATKYQGGQTIKSLSEEYGVSDSVIKRCLYNQKAHIRTNSESHSKWFLDASYFDKIDTMNKAYILGFMCADGWVTDRNEFGIGLNILDKDMVDFFIAELKTNKPVTFKNNNAVEIRLQNEKTATKLCEYGIVPRKSLIIDIGSVIKKANLNEEQIKAFLLGYFDGDGGFVKSTPTEKYKTIQYSSNITGTYETCKYYKEYFNNVGFFTKRRNDGSNNYTYCIGGRNMVRTAFSKLYEIKDELSFYYKRKYNKFIEM